MSTRSGQDFEVEVLQDLRLASFVESLLGFWSLIWSRIWSLCFMERLMFGWDFEVDAWSRFWRWNMIKICVWTCDVNSTLGSVVPLAMFSLNLEIWPFTKLYLSSINTWHFISDQNLVTLLAEERMAHYSEISPKHFDLRNIWIWINLMRWR